MLFAAIFLRDKVQIDCLSLIVFGKEIEKNEYTLILQPDSIPLFSWREKYQNNWIYCDTVALTIFSMKKESTQV